MAQTPSDIVSGTITLTNGSKTLIGIGTTWLADRLQGGDLIVFIEGGEDYAAPIIGEITSNTAGELEEEWTGPTLTGVRYRARYQWDSSRVGAMARNLVEKLGNGNVEALAALTGPGVPVFNGPHAMVIKPETDFINGVAYNVQVDTLADRAAYNGQSAGFSVLVSDVGDGRSAVYSKASNTSGDWTDPAYVTGPVSTVPGPPGVVPRGVWSGATTYALNDLVTNNGSSWRSLQNANTNHAPPTLPTTSNAWWELFAAKGTDGTGTGDVVGPPSSVADQFVSFDDTTGKRLKAAPYQPVNKAGDTATGVIRTPAMPALDAAPDYTYATGNGTHRIPLNSIPLNVGFTGTLSNARFVCTVAGRYRFTWTPVVLADVPDTGIFAAVIRKNGTIIREIYSNIVLYRNVLVAQRIIDMAVNDYVEFWLDISGLSGNPYVEAYRSYATAEMIA